MPSGKPGSGLRIGDACRDCQGIITVENCVYKGTYLQPRCKQCFNVHSNRVPSRTNDARHKQWVNWRYGLTPEQYDEKYRLQGGVCAICKQECEEGKHLAVDHDHTTGTVRDLLCSTCNTVLGLINDDRRYLQEFHEYLNKHAP